MGTRVIKKTKMNSIDEPLPRLMDMKTGTRQRKRSRRERSGRGRRERRKKN